MFPFDVEKNKGSSDSIHSIHVSEIHTDVRSDSIIGAPEEEESPLGQHVGKFTVVALNFSQMIGTGIFVTPGSILKGVGSIGASLMLWLLGIIISFSGFAVYTEFASMYPKRAGADVAYLEKAFPKPKYLMPVVFAVISVLLSYSASNAIVFSQYVLVAANREVTEWTQRGIAIAAIGGVCLLSWVSNKWSMRLQNVIAYVKVIILFFVAITGLVVLGGHTRVKNPKGHFKDPFKGTTGNANVWANALVKIIFSFAGWNNANNVLNEIPDAVRTVKIYGSVALGLVSVLYMLCAVAYFAAVSKEEIKHSNLLTAALFFKNVFGDSAGQRVLPALVAVSSIGNLLAVTIGHSRIVREVGRQGVLPWPSFWTNTWPFGTPGGALLVKFILTVIVIVAPPPGDAFNFVVDLQSYPSNIFLCLLVVGLFLVRRRRQKAGLGRAPFRAYTVVAIFYFLVSLFLLAAPWVPPPGGANGGDVSFWYATYCVVGIGIILVCGLYYYIWAVVWPKFGGFEHVEEIITLPDGSTFTKINRVKKDVTPPQSDESEEDIEEAKGARILEREVY
ncbi:High-affinity methionine permease [Yarrowia sp. E02]|nr:High-affinity methionine permease [Yarrowia sp. E02]